MPNKPLKTYQGGCSCGAFRFEVRGPEITDAYECNCGFCTKKGYLWMFPGKDGFKIIKGSDRTLTRYKFGPKKISHKFCGDCGTSVMSTTVGDDPAFDIALNAHTFQGLNTDSLQRMPFDGAAVGDAYIPPQHNGGLQINSIPEGRLYSGSCHCGSITVVLMSKEINGLDNLVSGDGNSSTQGGYIWMSHDIKHVEISRPLEKNDYTAVFCDVCGVMVAKHESPAACSLELNMRIFPELVTILE